jgi:hypothetical protein
VIRQVSRSAGGSGAFGYARGRVDTRDSHILEPLDRAEIERELDNR